MFDYEGSDPADSARKAGAALSRARHEVDKQGIKPFLFHAGSIDEFDQRILMRDVSAALDDAAEKYLNEISDGRAKLARSLKREFEASIQVEAGYYVPSSLMREGKDYPEEKRKEFAKKGWALSDGSFPIADCGDVKDAQHRVGTSKHSPGTIKSHIKKRWKALGCGGREPFSDDDSDD